MNDHQARSPFRQRWVPVIGLLLLSPICAEYLIGYDEGIGSPLGMLGGLLILAPLYGAIAVLIREVARRTGRGWPTILLLSAAFGLVQAGLIDQSLFSIEFDADDPAWATDQPEILIPGLGIDAGNLLNWVGGHVIWSFAAPIAVVEACAPRLADRPWLGRGGIVVMVALYLLAAAAIFGGVADKIGPVRFIGTTLVVLALAAIAFAIPRRPASSAGQAPPWWLVGCVAFVLFFANQFIPLTWAWAGFALNVVVLLVLGGLVLFWSGRGRWGRKHVLAVAGAALMVRGVLAFGVEPLGDVYYPMKYASNAVILVGVVGLLVLASHRLRRWEGSNPLPTGPWDAHPSSVRDGGEG